MLFLKDSSKVSMFNDQIYYKLETGRGADVCIPDHHFYHLTMKFIFAWSFDH